MKYNRSEEMMSYVPEYYRQSRIYQNQNDAKGMEIDIIREVIDDMLLQFQPQTATWSMKDWEELCGLEHRPSATLEERRVKVMTTLGKYPPITEKYLKEFISSILEETVEFEKARNAYTMWLVIKLKDRAFDVAPLAEIMGDLAPAHILFWYNAVVPPIILRNKNRWVFSDMGFHSGFRLMNNQKFVKLLFALFMVNRQEISNILGIRWNIRNNESLQYTKYGCLAKVNNLGEIYSFTGTNHFDGTILFDQIQKRSINLYELLICMKIGRKRKESRKQLCRYDLSVKNRFQFGKGCLVKGGVGRFDGETFFDGSRTFISETKEDL